MGGKIVTCFLFLIDSNSYQFRAQLDGEFDGLEAIKSGILSPNQFFQFPMIKFATSTCTVNGRLVLWSGFCLPMTNETGLRFYVEHCYAIGAF